MNRSGRSTHQAVYGQLMKSTAGGRPRSFRSMAKCKSAPSMRHTTFTANLNRKVGILDPAFEAYAACGETRVKRSDALCWRNLSVMTIISHFIPCCWTVVSRLSVQHCPTWEEMKFTSL